MLLNHTFICKTSKGYLPKCCWPRSDALALAVVESMGVNKEEFLDSFKN